MYGKTVFGDYIRAYTRMYGHVYLYVLCLCDYIQYLCVLMCAGWVTSDPWPCGVHQRAERSPSPPNLESREAGAQRPQLVSISLCMLQCSICWVQRLSITNLVQYIVFHCSFHSFKYDNTSTISTRVV